MGLDPHIERRLLVVRGPRKEQMLEQVRRLLAAAGKIPVPDIDGETQGDAPRDATGL